MEIRTAGQLVMQECHTVSADPTMLRSALARHAPGLENRIPNPPGHHAALRRAAQRRGTPKGLRWAEIGVDGNTLVFGLVAEESDVKIKDYTAETCGWVSVDEHGTVAMDRGVHRETVTELVERYRREAGILGAPEIWGLTVGICRDRGGVKIRDGVYFVPDSPQANQDLAGLAVALDEGASGVHLVVVPILPDHAATMAGPAERSLMDEVEEIRRTFEARKARQLETGRSMKASGIRTMLAETTDLVERAQALKLGLGLHVEEITSMVEALEVECLATLKALGE